MNGVRINETVASTARALHDSVHCFVDISSRQCPFEIPVSQLLRIEKDRGFKHDPNTKSTLAVAYFHRTRCDRRRSLVTDTHHRLDKRTVTTSRPLLLPPRYRSFSSQPNKDGPKKPPPRPPPPPRKPLIPSSNIPEDDVLGKMATNTGKQHARQSIHELAQSQKQQIITEKREFDFSKRIEPLNQTLKSVQKNIDRLRTSIPEVKRKFEELRTQMYKRGQSRVADLTSRVQDSAHYVFSALPGMIELDLRLARHLEVTGIDPLGRDIDLAATQADNLHQELLDLKYTIRWTVWNLRRTNFQLQETIDATRHLKAVGELQHTMNRKTMSLTEAVTELNVVMGDLRKNLSRTGGSLSQNQTQRYVQISIPLAAEFAEYLDRTPSEGHNWRGANFNALVQSRFPGLNNHVLSDFHNVSALTDLLSSLDATFDLIRAIRNHSRSDSLSYRRRAMWQDMAETHLKYSALVRSHRDQIIPFSRNGLFLSNPALTSDPGRLIFAALYPFKMMHITLGDFEAFCRVALESTKTYVKTLNQQGDLTIVQRAEIARIQRRREILGKAAEHTRKFVRSFLGDVGDLSIIIAARVLFINGNDSNLKRILSDMNERAKTQLIEEKTHNQELRSAELKLARVLDQLSSPTLYSDDKLANRLMDPIKLRGSDTLYHSKEPYPVELLSSNARIDQVLRGFPNGTIVGLDMCIDYTLDKPVYRFISIATTEKIFLIDWAPALREAVPAFHHFFSNPGITKIVHGDDILAAVLVVAQGTWNPAGFVNISDSMLETGTDFGALMTSAGPWKPPNIVYKSWGSFLKLFTDLAFSSTYNLWTFLSAVTPDRVTSLQSDIQPDLTAAIIQARNRLHERIASAGESGMAFGPVEWDNKGVFCTMRSALGNSQKFLDLRRVVAKIEAERFISDGFKRTHAVQDILAAYYRFTTFNQDLSTLSVVFKNKDIARDILRVTKRLRLPLHPNEVGRLMEVVQQTSTKGEELSELGPIFDTPVKDKRLGRKERQKKAAEAKSIKADIKVDKAGKHRELKDDKNITIKRMVTSKKRATEARIVRVQSVRKGSERLPRKEGSSHTRLDLDAIQSADKGDVEIPILRVRDICSAASRRRKRNTKARQLASSTYKGENLPTSDVEKTGDSTTGTVKVERTTDSKNGKVKAEANLPLRRIVRDVPPRRIAGDAPPRITQIQSSRGQDTAVNLAKDPAIGGHDAKASPGRRRPTRRSSRLKAEADTGFHERALSTPRVKPKDQKKKEKEKK